MTFEEAFDRLMLAEGGYTNDPSDPGGETIWGVSRRSYPQEWASGPPSRERARAIFKRDFWDRVSASDLFDGVAFQVADFAYNSGPETAVRALQRALGVADDGYFGPVSRSAAKAMSEPDQILRLNAERLDFMRRLSNWPAFGKGWAGRIAQNLRYGAIDS